ncbi:MAG TPA: RNA methyltransferase [Williamwhitmania sp.]|nr:RNA methyltransferase [Williamwhitmania sp.]
MDAAIISFLSQFISEERQEILKQVLSNRTKYLTVCLEDIYHPHNASAVLRTCDCLGLLDVHIVEKENRFCPSPQIAKGTYKWLNIHHYREEQEHTSGLIRQLRSQNYRIVATTPHQHDVALENFDISKGKVALFFGTEHSGISSTLMQEADEFLKIPIYGFAESMNISVAAAIIIHHLMLQLRSQKSFNWKLTEEEYNIQLVNWMKKSVKNAEPLIQHFLSKSE